jgi:hypothetical protein
MESAWRRKDPRVPEALRIASVGGADMRKGMMGTNLK